MLPSAKRKLSSLATTALIGRWHPPNPLLSSHFRTRFLISFSRESNSNWVPGKIANAWRVLDLGCVEGKSRYCSVASSGRCWSCGWDSSSFGTEPFLVCRSCKAVQPVDASVDYFRMFGIEKGFEIGEECLERKYKEWQKKLHPDLVHMKSEREKSYASEQSARVIDGYRILKSALSRATYLLELEGVQMNEEDTLSDPELLTEVMDIREAVEEAKDTKALENLRSQIQEKLKTCLNIFEKAFIERNFSSAVDIIKRMTYYEKALQEIIVRS